MLLDLLAEQVRVNSGRQNHEGCAEAGAEGRLWFRHAAFRSGDLGRIARQEVIHRLCGRQLGNWRQHAERVSSQHDNVRWISAQTVLCGVRNVADGIRSAGVFSQGRVIEIELASHGIEGNVLQNRAEAPGCGIDFWLRLSRQIDHLGIAAALEVEDAVIAPAVLVITNERA